MCELTWLWKSFCSVYKYQTITLYTLYIIFICQFYLSKAGNLLKTKKYPKKPLGLPNSCEVLRIEIYFNPDLHLESWQQFIPLSLASFPSLANIQNKSPSWNLVFPVFLFPYCLCFVAPGSFSQCCLFKITFMLLCGTSHFMKEKFPKSSALDICYIVIWIIVLKFKANLTILLLETSSSRQEVSKPQRKAYKTLLHLICTDLIFFHPFSLL